MCEWEILCAHVCRLLQQPEESERESYSKIIKKPTTLLLFLEYGVCVRPSTSYLFETNTNNHNNDNIFSCKCFQCQSWLLLHLSFQVFVTSFGGVWILFLNVETDFF